MIARVDVFEFLATAYLPPHVPRVKNLEPQRSPCPEWVAPDQPARSRRHLKMMYSSDSLYNGVRRFYIDITKPVILLSLITHTPMTKI